jgi:hypothetical protein
MLGANRKPEQMCLPIVGDHESSLGPEQADALSDPISKN